MLNALFPTENGLISFGFYFTIRKKTQKEFQKPTFCTMLSEAETSKYKKAM